MTVFVTFRVNIFRHTVWSRKQTDKGVDQDLRNTSADMLVIMPEDH